MIDQTENKGISNRTMDTPKGVCPVRPVKDAWRTSPLSPGHVRIVR